MKKNSQSKLETKINQLTEEKETMKLNLSSLIEELTKNNGELEKEVREYRKLKEEIRRSQEEEGDEKKSYWGIF
jgi:FtsZ-binding cell division protein ZapB